MPQGYFDETKATARLPNLDIEIVHSHSPEGDAERITVSLQAAPSFEAFGRFLEATNPFLFWMRPKNAKPRNGQKIDWESDHGHITLLSRALTMPPGTTFPL
jgi:hypothetical protein